MGLWLADQSHPPRPDHPVLHRRLDENESRLEDLLKDLNETKQNYNILKNKSDLENSRLTALTKLYENKISELNKNERELKHKAKLDAEKIIKDANKLIEKTIKEIREDKLKPKEIVRRRNV